MASTSERYQGWANYDTWNVILWLGNNEDAYKTVMNQIVFNVTLQMHKKAQTYGRAVESAAQRAFDGKTPDGVMLTPAKTKVDWEDAARYFEDDINQLEAEWVEVISKLPQNAKGGLSGIEEAKQQFRKDHKY